jgi:AraC family transcriptional regulator
MAIYVLSIHPTLSSRKKDQYRLSVIVCSIGRKMNKPTAPIVEILADLRKPDLSLQITRSIRRDTRHLVAPVDTYRVILCLTPRPVDARARYPASWNPTRFDALGDLCILPPELALEIRGDRQRQVTLTCHLSAGHVSRWLEGKADWNEPRLTASLQLSNPHIRALLMRLAEEAHRPGIGSDDLARHIAGQLGVEIARFHEATSELRAVGGLAPWRLRLIDERLQDHRSVPSVEDLASLCRLSVRHLARGFRASRGTSLREYCATVRIERAKRLLAGEDAIQSIAFMTGYASSSTFAQAFRLATGSSPRDFRQHMSRAVEDATSATPVLPD